MLLSLPVPIVLMLSAGFPAARSQSCEKAVGDGGNAFVQMKATSSHVFESDKRGIKQPKLRYVPHKYLEKCPSVQPDFGPHPNVGAVKGLGQHLQVAMEVTCTNFFMRCAYATRDFNLLAEAISGGLLPDAGLRKDREMLKHGIVAGAASVHKHGVNNRLEQQEDDVKCSALPKRDDQIKWLGEAIHAHFHAYQVAPTVLRNSASFVDGIALAFCDQIGDTGDSPCNDLMSQALGKALK